MDSTSESLGVDSDPNLLTRRETHANARSAYSAVQSVLPSAHSARQEPHIDAWRSAGDEPGLSVEDKSAVDELLHQGRTESRAPLQMLRGGWNPRTGLTGMRIANAVPVFLFLTLN
jgi:hypothetical protein